jgi:uncharacterized membrane protein (DUF485 family)
MVQLNAWLSNYRPSLFILHEVLDTFIIGIFIFFSHPTISLKPQISFQLDFAAFICTTIFLAIYFSMQSCKGFSYFIFLFNERDSKPEQLKEVGLQKNFLTNLNSLELLTIKLSLILLLSFGAQFFAPLFYDDAKFTVPAPITLGAQH